MSGSISSDAFCLKNLAPNNEMFSVIQVLIQVASWNYVNRQVKGNTQ